MKRFRSTHFLVIQQDNQYQPLTRYAMIMLDTPIEGVRTRSFYTRPRFRKVLQDLKLGLSMEESVEWVPADFTQEVGKPIVCDQFQLPSAGDWRILPRTPPGQRLTSSSLWHLYEDDEGGLHATINNFLFYKIFNAGELAKESERFFIIPDFPSVYDAKMEIDSSLCDLYAVEVREIDSQTLRTYANGGLCMVATFAGSSLFGIHKHPHGNTALNFLNSVADVDHVYKTFKNRPADGPGGLYKVRPYQR